MRAAGPRRARHPLYAALLLTALLALFAIACGGGDESEEETATPAATPEATATATPAPTEPPPTATPAGSVDERYLRTLCIASDEFAEALAVAAVRQDGVAENVEEFLEVFVEPIQALLGRFAEATPPEDLAAYHAASLALYEELLGAFSVMAEQAAAGEEFDQDPFEVFLTSIGSAAMNEDLVLPPASVARLLEVAEGVPECAGSLFVEQLAGEGPTVVEEDMGDGAGPSAEDIAYLRAICTAVNDFQASAVVAMFQAQGSDEARTDPEVFAAFFTAPLEAMLDRMGEVEAPADLVQFHAAAVAQYSQLIPLFEQLSEEAAADGEITEDPIGMLTAAFEGVGAPPALPPEVSARLRAAITAVPGCDGSSIVEQLLGIAEPGPEEGAAPSSEADISYVRSLCVAGGVYLAALEEALAEVGEEAAEILEDPVRGGLVMLEALRDLAAEMVTFTPPEDVAAIHEAGTARFSEMVGLLDAVKERIEDGAEATAEQVARIGELYAGGISFPGLTDDLANRLALAANEASECLGSGFLYSVLSASGG